MTLYSVDNPLPTILNLSGAGLNGGKVYIGLPNQDPQNFPKTVYWDAAGMVPVDQSNGIATIGGYLVNSGTPASVYKSGAYSIRVLDRFGVQVYYSALIDDGLADLSASLAAYIASVSASSGSSLVGYINSPTGSVARTVQNRLREKVSLKDFGALNDGLSGSSATNSAAMNLFGVWARAESVAGRAVHLEVPPGVYYWDQVTAANCFRGISKLTVSAYGAQFIQTNAAGQAWPQSADTLIYTNSSNPKVATALKDATTVTVTAPSVASDLAQYSVGETIAIMALNIQYNGYPPNMYCFDFIKIVTRDTTTGVMTFTPALRYDYYSTFPEYSNGSSSDEHPGGAPRLAKLDRNGYSWDVEHLFEGFDARNLNDVGTNYITPTGRKITFRDCVVPGFAESICQDFLAEGCTERLHTEPDKLVKKSVRRACNILTTFSLQSASVDTIVVENCRTALFAIGGKNLSVRDCDMDEVAYGGNYGFDNDSLFENCRIRKASNFFPYENIGTRLDYVDANNVTYASGVFTILKNQVSGIANGGGLSNWNVVPGQMLQFCRGTAGDLTAAGSHMASDLGAGIVLKVEEALGGTAIAITTTLSSAAVPAWSSGQVYKKLRNPPVFRGCTGNATIRMASQADKAGKIFGEYFYYIFAGKDIATNSITLDGRTGTLKRFYANVIKPLTGTAGGKVTFQDTETYVASTMGSKATYKIDLDLTIAGIREFTTAGLVGNVGNDLVDLGGVTKTSLVLDSWCEGGLGSMAYNYAPSGKTLTDLPIYEVIFEFDVGLYGKRVTVRSTGTGQVLLGTTGSIA
jgi:hypothetical protein